MGDGCGVRGAGCGVRGLLARLLTFWCNIRSPPMPSSLHYLKVLNDTGCDWATRRQDQKSIGSDTSQGAPDDDRIYR